MCSISSGLPEEQQQKIMQSSLLVYECEGEEKEIKEWFKTFNIVGIPLKEQELLNAIYSGEFVNAAKRVFSNSQMRKYRNGIIISREM